MNTQAPATVLLSATEVSNCHRIERCKSTHAHAAICPTTNTGEKKLVKKKKDNRNINQNIRNTLWATKINTTHKWHTQEEHGQRNVITKHLNHYYVKLRIHVVSLSQINKNNLCYCCYCFLAVFHPLDNSKSIIDMSLSFRVEQTSTIKVFGTIFFLFLNKLATHFFFEVEISSGPNADFILYFYFYSIFAVLFVRCSLLSVENVV